MKHILKISVICLVIATAFAAASINADAQTYTTAPSSSMAETRPGGTRAGTWDFFLPLTYQPSSIWNGQGGSSVDLDTTWGFGFGGGYNFSDHFQLNGIFSWAARNYSANVVNSDLTRRQYSNTLYTSTFALNGIFYFSKGHISPFISAGVGVTYLDTNIQTAPGTTSCWWDPWYGYVCNNSAPTKTESDFSYSVGAGIRFDLGKEFALQPSYNKQWVEVGNSSSTPSFDIWRIDFIFRLP